MRRRRLAVVALVAALAFPACFEDIELFLGDYDPTDLRKSADPAEKAAGNAAVAEKKEEQAQALVEQGVLEGSPEKLEAAAKLRPRDPRYQIYLGIQLGKSSYYNNAAGIIAENNPHHNSEEPDVNEPEEMRLFHEAWLEAVNDVLKVELHRTPPNDKRVAALKAAFCERLGAHEQRYGDIADAAKFNVYLRTLGQVTC